MIDMGGQTQAPSMPRQNRLWFENPHHTGIKNKSKNIKFKKNRFPKLHLSANPFLKNG
jgi:hypothetical protein